MNTTIKKTLTAKQDDCFVLITTDDKKIPSNFFSKEESKYILDQFASDKKVVYINRFNHAVAAVLINKKDNADRRLEAARKAGDTLCHAFNKQKFESVTIIENGNLPEISLAMAEGIALGNYQFLKYKKDIKKDSNSLKEIRLTGKKISDQDISELINVIEAVFLTRDLVNEPQSSLTATQLAHAFARMGKDAGFKTTIFNKAQIINEAMGGLLAVNKGSIEPPTFSIMEWKPAKAKNKNPIVIIGKGVVYDTGGLSLKPTANSMDYMKCDMGGAATVGGAMYAIAKSKLPVHVIALVPSTDNRPDGNAYAPGDVIKMHSGTTVEVLNTDAEGRMILADALSFAKKYKPELVLDFATLTGAAAVAIGPYGIVCMGTADEKTKNKLKASGNKVYERLAEFPLWDEYDELIKSDIAEIKNVGGPNAGAITAGKFLQRFTDYPWMHFDIAGPAFLHKADSYRGKNGSGVGVRLLFDYFKNM